MSTVYSWEGRDRYSSLRLWIERVGVLGKTVRSLEHLWGDDSGRGAVSTPLPFTLVEVCILLSAVLILSVVICSTSVKYSRTSVCKGTRLMALCDVALGRCHDTCQHDTTLTRPPDDFDSVHGVKGSDDVTSDFKVGYWKSFIYHTNGSTVIHRKKTILSKNNLS